MTTEDAVRAANAAFYDAFRARDLDAMDALWTRAHPALCVHPGWDVLRGREAVMKSWRRILANPNAPKLEGSDVAVALVGDAVALVTCREGAPGRGAGIVATNVFVLEEGQWRIAHHHAGPLAEPAPPTERPDPRTLN